MRIHTGLFAGRWLLAATLGSIGVLVGSSTALAGTLTAGKLALSPDDPLAANAACAPLVASQVAKGSVNSNDAEVEPYLVADPNNPKHLVAAFQQDRWNDGGANGATTVVSNNGGATWSLASQQPKFSICDGATPGAPGGLNRASDPWLSIGPDGTVYQASLSFNANGPAFGGTSGIVASSSSDGGNTWGPVTNVQLDPSTTVLNDKESITADPNKAGTAYLVWDRLVSPSTNANPTAFLHTPAFRGPALISKTTDGGKTWSPSRVFFDPGQNNQTIGNQIVVEPDGTLVDGLDLILNKGAKGNPRSAFLVATMRSTDGGATWSAPTIVSQIIDVPVSINGQGVRTGDILPEFAVDPASGTLYAAWQTESGSAPGVAGIDFSQSTDQGRTWSAPIEIDQAGGLAAFTTQVHVAADGTVGAIFYQFENTTNGLTDEFIVHCHAATDDCSKLNNWTAGGRTKLNPTAFDMTTAPNAGGFFTGDYEGLASSGNTFDAFFVMAQPVATRGQTDPFANTAS